ncbi:Ntn hydrolase family protein [Halosimplex salinum]|uniref:proteasome subunit beta n=1 Tax=Halosimplex salinum TaxID=1710538 RepID=UPI000F493312|nr:proteasome subunit beta [Halosimplex salinum]
MTPEDFGLREEPRRHELSHDHFGQSDAVDAPMFDTGTTIVAVTAEDGVVMAADQRMSLGGRFTANKNARKISRVHPRAAFAISGSVGPAQDVVRSLRAEASLYESRRDEPMSMAAVSQTAGHLVRGLPVAPILGGVDDEGGHVYELDGGGSVMADAYAAGGSGMQVAYGVLERRFEPGAALADATDAAVAAVDAACERDTASGNGVTVATITDAGVEIEAVDDASEATATEGRDAAGDSGEVA